MAVGGKKGDYNGGRHTYLAIFWPCLCMDLPGGGWGMEEYLHSHSGMVEVAIELLVTE